MKSFARFLFPAFSFRNNRLNNSYRYLTCALVFAPALCAILLSMAGCSLKNPVSLKSDDHPAAGLSNRVLDIVDGKRTRVIWVHGGYPIEGGGVLQGYDTKNGEISTIFCSTADIWVNFPLICDRGLRIVFTDTRDISLHRTYVINWDGTGLRYLSDGQCSQVWEEPGTGRLWAIIREGGASTAGSIFRIPLDTGSDRVLLWDRTPVGSVSNSSWYQVSSDGKRAVDCFPWGHKASYVVFDGGLTANGDYYSASTEGCWYSMSPDTTYAWFHLNWNTQYNLHNSFALYKDTVFRGNVSLDFGPEVQEHLHTRFASHGPGYVVTSVGYQCFSGDNPNCGEIALGKLDINAAAFETWVLLTSDTVPDLVPDAWIGVDEGAEVSLNRLEDPPRHPPGDSAQTGAVYIVKPYAGTVFSAADSINLIWQFSGPQHCLSGWMVGFSIDSGITWQSLTVDGALPVSTMKYRIPCDIFRADNTGDSCVPVVLEVKDYFNHAYRGTVGPVFVCAP